MDFYQVLERNKDYPFGPFFSNWANLTKKCIINYSRPSIFLFEVRFFQKKKLCQCFLFFLAFDIFQLSLSCVFNNSIGPFKFLFKKFEERMEYLCSLLFFQTFFFI